jgi:hypothetical protein
MVDRPTLTVEVAFADGALDTTGLTWTDISAYVRSISVRRGRTDELDAFQPGTCTLVLDNRDRRFDPLNTASPYVGNLRARRQVRVTATYAAVSYPIFRGHVRGFGVAPDVSRDSVWTVQATDGLAYLAGIDMPASVLALQAGYAIPGLVAYLPLGSSDVIAVDQYGAYDYTHTTASPRTSSEIGPFLPGQVQEYDGTYGTIGPTLNSTGAWAVSFWFKTTTAGPAGGLNPIIASAGGGDLLTIGIDEYGRLAYRRGATNTAHSGFSAIEPESWHHGTVGYDGSGVPQIWVDGTLLSSGNATGTGGDGTGINLLGMSLTAADSPYYTGHLAHVQVYGPMSPLTVADVARLTYAAGNTGTWLDDSAGASPYTPLTSGALIEATIAATAAWPSTWVSAETGGTTPTGLRPGGTLLGFLQAIATTERGRVFVDPSGILIFHAGSHDYTATRALTSQATYSDSGGATVVPYSAISEIAYNDDRLINEATVETGAGASYTATDATSTADYGIRRQTYATYLPSVDAARTYAEVIVSQYADPQLRVDSWTTIPQGKPAVAFPAVLGALIADRVTLGLFSSSASAISKSLLIEAIQHDATPEAWSTTLSASPAVDAWLLEDTTYGLLGTTTTLG